MAQIFSYAMIPPSVMDCKPAFYFITESHIPLIDMIDTPQYIDKSHHSTLIH